MSTSAAAGQSTVSSSSSSSPSNSISLIRLDELSSFGATKQSRLPALIKLNPLADQQQQQQQQQQLQASSMPDFSASQVEKMAVVTEASQQQAESLPIKLAAPSGEQVENKENNTSSLAVADDFHVVSMDEGQEATNELGTGAGPSLPAPKPTTENATETETQTAMADGKQKSYASLLEHVDAKSLSAQLQSTNLAGGPYASHLGDSLIEMIINLRNENQNLVRALETNNEYVKERLSEFKRCQEEAKRRESQHAQEKAEFEHQARKLRRQNSVLSDRLKSLEAKLCEMNVEVCQSLDAAHSSKASSVRDPNEQLLYPQLTDNDSFNNSALQQQQQQESTMQIDATSGELYNQGDERESLEAGREQQMDTSGGNEATSGRLVGELSPDELSRRFDAQKATTSDEDPMKQCDRLEQQLNDIGRRDYEICLLQQQLNIYRQDFRLERMAKLEAKLQIEKLKADIDRLCLARHQEQEREVRFAPTGDSQQVPTGSNLIGKLGHQLGKKAVRSAAKAAKYAAKQAHLEEKAAAAMARAAAAKAAASCHFAPATAGDVPTSGEQATDSQSQHHHLGHHHGHHRGHRRSSSGRGAGGIRSEVMTDLLSTANKAMLTGYKMASTHVNLALDKLSQFEQQQAAQLDPNSKPTIQKAAPASSSGPSAPPMEPPSID